MIKFLCFFSIFIFFPSLFLQNTCTAKGFSPIVHLSKKNNTVLGAPLSHTATSTNPTCNGTNSGSITITAIDGTGPFVYSINGGVSFQSNNIFNGLPHGTYPIVVMDADLDQSPASSITLVDPPIINVSSSVTKENCGHADGSITITATGGTGALRYSINGGGSFQSSNIFTGLTATTYNIVVEDINSCQAFAAQSIGSNGGPVLSTIHRTNATCFGSVNGSITVNATGIGPLLYSNDNGTTFQTSNIFTGLAAGAYLIVVEDGIGCQTFAGTVNITQPAVINISTTSNDENCGNSDGSITINTTGGIGSYQYSNNGGVTFQSSNTFSGLSLGSYNIIVKDANGCQSSSSQSVQSNDGPVASNITHNNVSCHNGTDGDILITATGATSLLYSIDGGATFQSNNSFSGLAIGSFSIILEDTFGCQTSGGNLSISEPSLITPSTSTTNENCGNNDGTIAISASGGTGALQYSIDGGSTFQPNGLFSGLTSGNFTTVVKDINGCQVTSSVHVGSNGFPSIANVTTTNESCFAANDGQIVIAATGAASMLYSIDGGLTFITSSSFTGLSGGSYNIIIEDGNGCQTTGPTEVITTPNQITYTSVITNENCGQSDGSITITANNNIGATSYSINNGTNFQSSNIFSGLQAGTYNITIEDGNGCTGAGIESVNNNSGPTITALHPTPVTCFGDASGSITVDASGGTGTLEYSFDGGSTFQNSNNTSNLQSGNYSITVKDPNNCTANATATINTPPIIASTINGTDANCGANDGTATVTASGGTGTLTFLWNDINNQSGTTATGLASGTYTVSITDANNCQTSNTITINTTGQLTLTTSVTNVTCHNLSDGNAQVTVSGGSAPYTFLWNDPANQTNAAATNLSTGNYNVAVTDNTGCTTSTLVTITEPNPLQVTLTETHTTCAINNGTILSLVSGGTGPYHYEWDDANFQSSPTAINLAPGLYTLEITDAKNCILNASANINPSDSLVATLVVTDVSCPEKTDGAISTIIGSGQPPYQFSWNTGDTSSLLSNLTIGNYTLTAVDADNCSTEVSTEVNMQHEACLKIPTAISPNGDGANDTWVIYGLSNFPDAIVEVYNRWGSLIMSSNDYQNDWDGTYNGENVDAGVYYFIVTLEDESTHTGSLTVIR